MFSVETFSLATRTSRTSRIEKSGIKLQCLSENKERNSCFELLGGSTIEDLRNRDSTPEGGEWILLIRPVLGRAAGQGMVLFWPRCPEQGVQFYSLCSKKSQNLSQTGYGLSLRTGSLEF